MTIFNSILLGVLGGLIGLKLALLAIAAGLFVHGLNTHANQPSAVPVPARARRTRLDVRA